MANRDGDPDPGSTADDSAAGADPNPTGPAPDVSTPVRNIQPRFTELGDTDRRIYILTVVLGAATTGALIGPVSIHRLLTGRRLKPQTVAWTSRLTVLGLALLLCTMACALLLILRVATTDGIALWLVIGMVVWFAVCWFLLPAWARASAKD